MGTRPSLARGVTVLLVVSTLRVQMLACRPVPIALERSSSILH